MELVILIWFVGFIISFFYLRVRMGHESWSDVFLNVILSSFSWLVILVLTAAFIGEAEFWDKKPPKWL